MVAGSYEMSRRRTKTCPKCSTRDQVVDVIYGMPGPELVLAVERGEVVLGGCNIGGADPSLHCRKCGIFFAFDQPELATGETADLGWTAEIV